jgi:hypothetical protein
MLTKMFERGRWLALVSVVLGWPVQAQVTLNEFVALNLRTWRDEDRDLSDWIEIHNAGEEAVNLGGWFLTDDARNPRKWMFPATNLPPHGFLLVMASGKDRAVAGKQLHTNFKLDAQGEYLALIEPEGRIATEYAPRFPRQFADISYGLLKGRECYFRKATPLAPNSDDTFTEFVADTKFSHHRGFYTDPFELTITTATEGATIRYTTNGSPPTADTGKVYTGPLRIAGTTVLRAAAFKEGMQPSNVDTQTYLFLADVPRQSPRGTAPPGWPASWGANTVDYGMDPDVVNSPKWGPQIEEALASLPTFSVVMDLDDLFDPQRGIYANARNDGRGAERPCSIELLHPDGRKGFQINCGIRIRGGFSRSSNNPKHAFRLFFREAYGATKLKYPLFGDEGADTFDAVDLRTFQNYSWSFQGDRRGIFIRDQWNRDTQLAMGHQGERGEFYHLYINGQYWGLYNTCERPEASYAETYYGGKKDDYDVIKVEAGPYALYATDGNFDAWRRLYNAAKAGLASDAAYERIQGHNPDGTPNPEYENLVEVDNLIDYMLIIIYGGNLDAPISNFLGNNRPNNWYGIRNRTGAYGGFRFFVHDAEHTLLNVNQNRMGPWPAGNSSMSYSNPQWIWQQMWANPEFRIHCADRIHKYFFNGGLLTPEACRKRFDERIAEIEKAVIAESARWGDAKRSIPLTQDDWRRTVNDIRNNYLPRRSGIVLDQLRSKGLYPNVAAPAFGLPGGPIDAGTRLRMTAPAGPIYYTTDGSDPRQRGGAVSPNARVYRAPVTLNETTTVKARVRSGTTWSALNEATYTLRQTYTNLLITEIMYHPAKEGEVDGDEYEFIELKNANAFEVDLSGVRFTEGIHYVFPNGTHLAPGAMLVLVRNAGRFAERHPDVPVAGVYTGGLSNGGERLTLVHAVGTPLFSVKYDDRLPWPPTADGKGFSLVPVNPNFNPDPDNPRQWRASTEAGGSPGQDDPVSNLVPVVVNEALSRPVPPGKDAIELHNPTDTPADIGHWLLTDNRAKPHKFVIPAGTRIPPGGYLVFDEDDFNPAPGGTPGFALNDRGEEVYLYSADAAGELTGYAHGFSFGAAASGVSFGRYTNSVGRIQYPPQKERTLGAANAGPRVGPVVISEIQYHPKPGDTEFIELKNITDDAVPLFAPEHPTNTWRLNGAGFSFPQNLTLPPQGLALVVGGNPDRFRLRYGVPDSVPIFGPFDGVLQDDGELLELQRPELSPAGTNDAARVTFITVDAVRYHDRAPWPTNAAGFGPSLERRHVAEYGNDPANWRASFGLPSPGLDNDGNRPPLVDAGPGVTQAAARFPVRVPLAGSATDDGLPEDGALRVTWMQVDGPGRAVFDDPHAQETDVFLPGVGTYLLRLQASDGELRVSDDVTVTITRPSQEQTLVEAGAVWRYLDDGSDQGTAWRAPDFDDSNWASGPAELGYGDGDVVTVVSYGDDSRHKHTTTYFRRRFRVTGAASVTHLELGVVRDDGVVVYLNGEEVMRDNMPTGDITFDLWANSAVGGADETNFQTREVDPSHLREGENVLAVEIHQANPTSSDISFNLRLTAEMFPVDQPPTVDAGPDRKAVAGQPVRLEGGFNDDGLPVPPGFTTLTWSKVSGPGEVTFSRPQSWITDATFGEPGAYRLRLTANDGATAVSDEVRITIEAAPPPLRFEHIAFHPGKPPKLILKISGPAGAKVRLQSRKQFGAGAWETVRDLQIPPGHTPATVEIPVTPGETSRFYRVLLPGDARTLLP